MATLTIRNLPEETRRALKERAARHDRSMEAEVREILHAAVASEGVNFGRQLLDAMAEVRALGGVELDIPPREASRPVEFD